MKIALHILATGLAVTGFAAVATSAQSDSERVRQVIVFGNDPCPASSNDEIVVCARRPDNDRYRIPENLRDGERMEGGESWASRAESIEYMGKSGIGSCSTSGPGGATGCWAEMMRQAREERKANAQPRR